MALPQLPGQSRAWFAGRASGLLDQHPYGRLGRGCAQLHRAARGPRHRDRADWPWDASPDQEGHRSPSVCLCSGVSRHRQSAHRRSFRFGYRRRFGHERAPSQPVVGGYPRQGRGARAPGRRPRGASGSSPKGAGRYRETGLRGTAEGSRSTGTARHGRRRRLEAAGRGRRTTPTRYVCTPPPR